MAILADPEVALAVRGGLGVHLLGVCPHARSEPADVHRQLPSGVTHDAHDHRARVAKNASPRSGKVAAAKAVADDAG